MVIIGGCPRSGTYLLGSMIESRFGVRVCTESHLLSLCFEIFGAKKVRGCHAPFVVSILRKLLLVNNFGAVGLRHCKAFTQYSIFGSLGSVRGQCRKTFFELIDQASVTTKGTQWLYENVAYPEFKQLKSLMEVPEIKLLLVTREPSEVALSWISTWFGPIGYNRALSIVEKYNSSIFLLANQYPDRVMVVRFDYLVTGQIDWSNVAVFIQAPFVTRQTDSRLAEIVGKLPTHRKLSNNNSPSLRPNSLSQRILLLSRKYLAIILKMIQRNLNRLVLNLLSLFFFEGR